MNNHCLRAVESRVDFGLTTHQIEEHPDYDDDDDTVLHLFQLYLH